MEEQKNLVVVDAANILRDDRGCIIRDENQNRLTQMRPERLNLVIKYIKNKGRQPICILRKGTYHSGNKRKDSDDPRFGDWSLVEKGIESGDIVVVSDDDDMYCISLALQTDSYLLSRDKFKSEKRKYPEYDWKRLDSLRIEDYNFIAGRFVSPELERAISMDSLNGSKTNKTIVKNINPNVPEEKGKKPQKKVSNSLITHENQLKEPNQISSNGSSKGENTEDLMILLDELYASLYSLTADDGKCNGSLVLTMLAKEFLGKVEPSSDWKKGWVAELKSHIVSITGVNQRPIKWVVSNLPEDFSYSKPHIIRN